MFVLQYLQTNKANKALLLLKRFHFTADEETKLICK